MGIQLIPVSEVTAKDEFFTITNVTRDDLLSAHRGPAQLIGIVPSNPCGLGAANTAAEVFGSNEIKPLQRRFEQLNEWIGDEVVRFNVYAIEQPESFAQMRQRASKIEIGNDETADNVSSA